MKSIWMKAYPEMQAFLQAREDRKFSTAENTYYIGETFTGRIRVRADFCSALNVRFQGTAADGAKCALWLAWLENLPVVNFIHDELLTEVPLDSSLPAVIAKQEHIMIDGMRRVLKNTPVKVESTLMKNWNKKAKGIYADDGRMLVWTPGIQVIPKGDPKADMPKAEALTEAQKMGDVRPVWKDPQCKSLYGFQPLVEALN